MLEPETDASLAEARPANVWLGAPTWGPNAERHFMLQCAFCHQQGNAFLRQEALAGRERCDPAHGALRLAPVDRRPACAARNC